MKKSTIRTMVGATMLAAVLLPIIASAALTTPTPPVTGTAIRGETIKRLIESIVQFLITISVIVAVGFIVWGGLQYVRGKPDEGKEILKNGIIGVAIILGVGLIMSTISRFVLTQSIG